MQNPTKIYECTYGSRIFMSILMPNGHTEQIDVYIQEDGSKKYKTSADTRSTSDRLDIIKAFELLY